MNETDHGFSRLQPSPDGAPAALLLIDVINDLEFPGGENLLEHALPMSSALARLKRRAKELSMPAIYVNDNFGRWRSDFPKLVKRCLQPHVRGRPIVEKLLPDEDDYFVLKPRHSAFFQTSLEILLGYLGAKRLILTGIAGDICVLFSANDAYMRAFNVFVPADCIASESEQRNQQALTLMQRVLKADITISTELDLASTMGLGQLRE